VLSKDRNPANPAIRAAINQIASDTRSGAAEILQNAAAVFRLLTPSQTANESLTDQDARSLILETCAALIEAQPDMAPIRNLANAVVTSQADRADSARQAGDVLDCAAHEADRFTQDARRAAYAAASHAANLISDGATVMTHSRSSTVLAAFRQAMSAGRRFSVIATESRPQLEGRLLAAELAREGARVTVVADGAATVMMEQTDFILIGADRVTPECLVNKIGTHAMALAARASGVPVYAIADETKFINAHHSISARAGSELWSDPPAGVTAVNYYFEPTPLDYFTAIITQQGALSAERARLRAEEKKIATELARYLDSLAIST
jgi:translation initiation factor eIF-2B subunit delta